MAQNAWPKTLANFPDQQLQSKMYYVKIACGHKEAQRSTGHIVVTSCCVHHQGSGSRQKNHLVSYTNPEPSYPIVVVILIPIISTMMHSLLKEESDDHIHFLLYTKASFQSSDLLVCSRKVKLTLLVLVLPKYTAPNTQ